MDFLDPRKQRTYKMRLIAGYILVAIALGLGTLILVFGAAGYGFNTKNGAVVQNGLLFLDSKPGGARIYLNGDDQGSNTSARMVLPAGEYKIELKKNGYRQWQRNFVLAEQTISRFVYPFLFPEKLTSNNIKTYSVEPAIIGTGSDHRWLLLKTGVGEIDSINFDLFDLSSSPLAPAGAVLGTNVLTKPAQSNEVTPIEWSSDNKRLLLKHAYPGGSEYIIFNRENPAESVNLNKLFKLNPTKVALKNKKVDQIYLYSEADHSLQVGDISQATLQPLLKKVLDFKPYGSSLILYISDQDTTAGQVSAKIWENEKTYQLSTFTAGESYLINLAQYQNHFYYIVGSNKSERLNIYKDPLSGIKNPAVGKAVPLFAFHNAAASDVSFSSNARFLAAQAGQSISVYDFETQNYYRYSVSEKLDGPLSWMDGHRLIGSSSGTVIVSDYDGTNRQLLSATKYILGGVFDKDFSRLYTIADNAGKPSLVSTEMRAGADLPQ